MAHPLHWGRSLARLWSLSSLVSRRRAGRALTATATDTAGGRHGLPATAGAMPLGALPPGTLAGVPAAPPPGFAPRPVTRSMPAATAAPVTPDTLAGPVGTPAASGAAGQIRPAGPTRAAGPIHAAGSNSAAGSISAAPAASGPASATGTTGATSTTSAEELAALTTALHQLAQGAPGAALPAQAGPALQPLLQALAQWQQAGSARLQAAEQARAAAEAANRAKSLFLASTSHELRTPLNGLLGMARLARQPGLDEAKRQRFLELLVDAGQQLSEIVSDTLDLAKIEAGRLELDERPFELRALLQNTLATYRPQADAAGLNLVLAVDAEVPAWVQGDALRVRQIVANYVGNALKFTERGSIRVRISARPGHRLRIAVSDDGPGIAPAVAARLFRPFEQGEGSVAERQRGTGLGLAICRQLATRMGGEVGLCSAAEGAGGGSHSGGSTFWAELPLPAASGGTAAAEPLAAEPPGQARHLAGRRALVVEDNPINRVLAMALLETWGLHATPAWDGEQALAELLRAAERQQPYDLVLMDLQMPVLDGLAATRALRRRWSAEELPVLALTASALAHERAEALEAGINEVMTKPIDTVRLRAALCRHLPHGPARPAAPQHGADPGAATSTGTSAGTSARTAA